MVKSIASALKLSEIREALNASKCGRGPDRRSNGPKSAICSRVRKRLKRNIANRYRPRMTRGPRRPSRTPKRASGWQLVSRASLGAIFSRAPSSIGQPRASNPSCRRRYTLAPTQVPIDLLRAPVEERAFTPAPSHVGASEQADPDANLRGPVTRRFSSVDQVSGPEW